MIHKEEKKYKSEKFGSQVLKDQLVDFDGHTIYQIYIAKQKRIIMVKNLHIIVDIETESNKIFLIYNDILTFQGLLLKDNNNINENFHIYPNAKKLITPKAQSSKDFNSKKLIQLIPKLI